MDLTLIVIITINNNDYNPVARCCQIIFLFFSREVAALVTDRLPIAVVSKFL